MSAYEPCCEETASNLAARVREAGIEAPLAQRLAAYGALLLEASWRMNLAGAKTPGAPVPHVLDSLTLLRSSAIPLVDVGSGGGLPAIPMATATGVNVTLIEAISKRARFWKGHCDGSKSRARPSMRAPRSRQKAVPRTATAFGSGTIRAGTEAAASIEPLLPFIAAWPPSEVQ